MHTTEIDLAAEQYERIMRHEPPEELAPFINLLMECWRERGYAALDPRQDALIVLAVLCFIRIEGIAAQLDHPGLS